MTENEPEDRRLSDLERVRDDYDTLMRACFPTLLETAERELAAQRELIEAERRLRRERQHQLSQALHASGEWELEATAKARQAAALTRQVADLKEGNLRTTGDLLTLMAQRDEARRMAKDLAAVCDGLQSALENQRDRVRQLETENHKLRNKLDALIAERGGLIVDSKRLAERVDRLRRLLAKEDARRHGHLIPGPHPETTPPPPRDITRCPDDLEPGGFKCPWCGEPRWYVRGKWRHGESARRAMHETSDSWHRRDGAPARAWDGHILRYLDLPPLPWRWERHVGSFWKAPTSFEEQGRFFRREDSESAAALEEQRATWHQRLVGWLTLAPEVGNG